MIAYYGLPKKSGWPATGLFLQKEKLENTPGFWYYIAELKIPDGAKVGERFYTVMGMYGDCPLESTVSHASEAEAEAECARQLAKQAGLPASDCLHKLFVICLEVEG